MPDRRSPERVAFVTGASRGIGRLVARSLADDGARVVGMARQSDELDSLVTECRAGSAFAVAVDVSDPVDVEQAFERAVDAVGPPTLLITCAGRADALGPVATVDPDRWWQAVAVDLRGTMLCARAALRWMLPAGSGRIVTVYGNLGDHGAAHLSAFAAAKAAIARFTETLATELAGSGVVALSMHPGFVRTPMTEQLAYGADGREWLPQWGPRAEQHWGDGTEAIELVARIEAGDADAMAGRLVIAGDDLGSLAGRVDAEADLRSLRLDDG